MSITKNLCGAWVIMDLINGFLVRRSYYGFTKKQAIAAFKLETKQ